ncbi:putative RNA-binding protein NOB1 [Daphnia magna]|uniref:Putative RNA-binding protein NOB1 n=1 Tax=Daphnia magna TaxID=35525 RepID=A0A164JFT9_9CRUS|nr:putative RNA-binding protein NOB1 [Daphnia magna]
MQNVLMQMGLHVVSLEGRLIHEARTYILRCYACFRTTSNVTKVFCPKCGNQTLKKVAVSLNEDGTLQIHISSRKKLTARGKKFSLPMPKGGKYRAIRSLWKINEKLSNELHVWAVPKRMRWILTTLQEIPLLLSTTFIRGQPNLDERVVHLTTLKSAKPG